MQIKKDRRVQQSRHLIKQTYISLIHEKRSTAVSITEIVARCNMNRSTFYMHFETKEHLQNQITVEFIEELCAVVQQHAQTSPKSFFDHHVQLATFRYVEQHSFAFHTLLTYTDSFLRKLSFELYNLFLLSVQDTISSPQIVATYYASVITGMIYHWSIETNYQYSALYMAQETTKLFESTMLFQEQIK